MTGRDGARGGFLCLIVATSILLGGAARAQVFGPPAILNTNAATDTGRDLGPVIAVTAGGALVAAWETTESLGGTIGTEGDILFARSLDGGVSWTAPAPLNSNAATDAGGDGQVALAADGAGSVVAVWRSFDSLGGAIGTDGDILFARSADGGATWSAPAPLNGNAATDSGPDSAPTLVTDGGGAWVAAWQSSSLPAGGSDGDIAVARSSDGGATWSAPALLNTNAATDTGNDGDPQLATDGAGAWVAVWQSTDSLGGTIGSDFDILGARSTDGGVTWSAPAPVNTNAASDGSATDQQPAVAYDAGGGWVTVWATEAGGLGSDGDVVAARSTDGGVTWTPRLALDPGATTDGGEDGGAVVGSDGAGTLLAVWAAFDWQDSEGELLVVRSSDGGATWTAPVPLNADALTDTRTDLTGAIVSSAPGQWVAVWYGEIAGFDEDIITARGAVCGDGLVRFPEDCEDGNTVGGDCCSASCGFEFIGSPCGTDGNSCTSDICDAAGACTHPANTLPCDDGNTCTADDRCAGGTCVGGPSPCDPCEVCVPPTGCAVPVALGCQPAPAGKAAISLKDNPDPAKDKLSWKWVSSAGVDRPDLGSPTTTTDLRLCVIDDLDGVPTLRLGATVPAAGACPPGRPCWKETTTQLKYADRDATPDGVAKLALKHGAAGKAKIVLKGKGVHLGPPAPPLTPPVLVRLQRNDGPACWEATFSTPETNEPGRFKAKSE